MNPNTGELVVLTAEQQEMEPSAVLRRDRIVPISAAVADLLRAGMEARNRSERRLQRRLRLDG